VLLVTLEREAADVLSRLVKWYPNEEAAWKGVHQSVEIRHVFINFTPMRKNTVLSDTFWVEYRRGHKGILSMTRKPKRRAHNITKRQENMFWIFQDSL
jgi:hypothetical protein